MGVGQALSESRGGRAASPRRVPAPVVALAFLMWGAALYIGLSFADWWLLLVSA